MSFFKIKFTTISSENPKKADSEKENVNLTLNLELKDHQASFSLNKDKVKEKRLNRSLDPDSNRSDSNRSLNSNEFFELNYNPSLNCISGYYQNKEDIDLNAVDAIISHQLQNRFPSEASKKKLNDIETLLQKPCSHLQKKWLLTEKNKLESLNQTDYYKEYKIKVKSILEDYNNNLKVDWDQWVELTTNYINYDLLTKRNIKNECKGCHYQLETDYDDIIVCGRCGCENTIFNKIGNNSDLTFTSKKNKNEINFKDAYLRFIGEFNIKIPQNLEIRLDQYFTSIGMPLGADIRKKDLLDDGTKRIRPGTSINLMIKALKWCGLNEYYKHVRYLCQYYWGWELKNYDHLEDELMFRYKVTADKYNQIKKGSSNLNTNFHLKMLLQSLGCPCKDKDFKEVKVKTTINKYRTYWNEIIEMVSADDDCIYWRGKIINWK